MHKDTCIVEDISENIYWSVGWGWYAVLILVGDVIKHSWFQWIRRIYIIIYGVASHIWSSHFTHYNKTLTFSFTTHSNTSIPTGGFLSRHCSALCLSHSHIGAGIFHTFTAKCLHLFIGMTPWNSRKSCQLKKLLETFCTAWEEEVAAAGSCCRPW